MKGRRRKRPTALVHEAYLRLTQREELTPGDRGHFFALAAQTMRRVLIDHAHPQAQEARLGPGPGITRRRLCDLAW